MVNEKMDGIFYVLNNPISTRHQKIELNECHHNLKCSFDDSHFINGARRKIYRNVHLKFYWGHSRRVFQCVIAKLWFNLFI